MKWNSNHVDMFCRYQTEAKELKNSDKTRKVVTTWPYSCIKIATSEQETSNEERGSKSKTKLTKTWNPLWISTYSCRVTCIYNIRYAYIYYEMVKQLKHMFPNYFQNQKRIKYGQPFCGLIIASIIYVPIVQEFSIWKMSKMENLRGIHKMMTKF